MAAPSINLGTLIDLSVVTELIINGSPISVIQSSNHIFFDFNYISGTTYEIDYPTGGLDFSNSIISLLCFGGNSASSAGAGATVSFIDSNSIARSYILRFTNNSNAVGIFDLDQPGDIADSGPGFDSSSINTIRFTFLSIQNQSNSRFRLYFIRYVDRAVGITISGGEVGNEVTLKRIRELYLPSFETGTGLNTQGFNEYLLIDQPLTISADLFQATGASIVVANNVTNPGFRFASKKTGTIPITVNLASATNVLGFHVKGEENFPFTFADISINPNTFPDFILGNHHGANLGVSNYIGTIGPVSGITEGGNDLRINFKGTTADYDYEYNETVDLAGSEFSGNSEHYMNFDGANFTSGHTVDLSEVVFSGTPSIKHFRVDATGKNLSIVVPIGSGLSLSDVSIINAGVITIEEPQNAITITGIPQVAGVLLAVVDMVTEVATFPPLSGSSVVVPLDPTRNYRFVLDAPGYLAQRVVLAGNTPAFEFNLPNYRALYESGVSRASQISFNYQTFRVGVSDELLTYPYRDVFRTIEDYLATEEGILFPFPPVPIQVGSGAGTRNYLIFPYDDQLDTPNPVRIAPDPQNAADPTFTDFVVVLEGSESPLFDIWDFSQGGGRTIRFQTEAVSVIGGGGGEIPPNLEALLSGIQDQLEADYFKGESRFQKFRKGTQQVIYDKDVVLDSSGFTVTEHSE